MNIPTFAGRTLALIALGLVVTVPLTGCRRPPESGQSQVVEGLRFEYGLAPAAVVGAHPGDHPEATMHGGVSGQANRYHVVLALFNAASGARVGDAEVTMGLSGPGHPGVGGPTLEPMIIEGQASYGGYVVLPKASRYDLAFYVRRPGVHPAHVKAQFALDRPA
jgi:hypothetical protein